MVGRVVASGRKNVNGGQSRGSGGRHVNDGQSRAVEGGT